MLRLLRILRPFLVFPRSPIHYSVSFFLFVFFSVHRHLFCSLHLFYYFQVFCAEIQRVVFPPPSQGPQIYQKPMHFPPTDNFPDSFCIFFACFLHFHRISFALYALFVAFQHLFRSPCHSLKGFCTALNSFCTHSLFCTFFAYLSLLLFPRFSLTCTLNEHSTSGSSGSEGGPSSVQYPLRSLRLAPPLRNQRQ